MRIDLLAKRMSGSHGRWMRFAVWGAVFAVYLVVYGRNLAFPPEMYYDEVYFVKTAKEILALSGYTDTVQPPLGKLFIAASILIFGDETWAWRLPSLLFGFGCFVVFFRIVRRLTSKAWLAALAVFLFAFDQVAFTQHRVGMLNASMFFFMLLSVDFLMQHSESGTLARHRAFLGSGLSLAFATSCRLIGMTVAPLLAIFYWKAWQKAESKKDFLKDTALYYVVIPFIAFECTYLVIPFIKDLDWSTVVKLQQYMMKYHMTLKAGHTYGSEWWTWPLLLRPIWYFFKMFDGPAERMVNGILCIGNPVVFWAAIPAIVWGVAEFKRTRDRVLFFALTGYATQWLQWALVDRVKFFHYIHTAMPFAALILALALERIWRLNRWGRVAVVVYLAAVVGMFAYWYPLLNGLDIPERLFRQHMWLKGWI